MLTQAQIVQQLGEFQELPTLPTVVQQILELTRNPRAHATDMGALIGQDQTLTSKVLKLVNSAFYGFPKQINSITRAIVILGFDKVKNLALAASVFGALKLKRGGITFDLARFWEHALAVGITAEALGHRVGSAYKDDAFVAGLLHDIGKLVIIQHFDLQFELILYKTAKNGLLWADAETEALEGGHTFIGSWLAEQWNFPPKLVAPIRFHHAPEKDRAHRELTYLIHAADIFVRALDVGDPGDRAIPRFSPNVWETFKLDSAALDELFDEVYAKVSKVGAFIELVGK